MRRPSPERVRDLAIGSVVGVVGAIPAGIATAWIATTDGFPVLYRSERIGRGGQAFTVLKLRTMRVDASASKVDTTAADDPRLLPGAMLVRRLKVDELPQILNILNGSMSVVGPRPNVAREVAKYSDDERGLLAVAPGLTDLASVALADLAQLVDGLGDANAAYEQHIRPAKSALSLYHVDHRSATFDLGVIVLTALAVFSPGLATSLLHRWLRRRGATEIEPHLLHLEQLRGT